MGDVVHTLPVVADIARAFPHARIDWVVEEAFAAIPALHPGVTRVLPVALRRWRRAPLSRRNWGELLEARAAVRRTRYHDVIDCQGLVKSALVARWARGPVTGFSAASAREPLASLFYRRRVVVPRTLHAIERSRRLAGAALGYVPEGAPRFGLRLGEESASQPPFALLLTNASRATKLWPDERWIELERWLAARGISSRLAWGSAGEERATRARAASMRSARVLESLGLDELARIAAGARLVVGLDTGLTHLAAAIGAPTLGIFCDYDPALVGLCGEGRVQSLGGVDRPPPVEAVLHAAGELLAG